LPQKKIFLCTKLLKVAEQASFLQYDMDRVDVWPLLTRSLKKMDNDNNNNDNNSNYSSNNNNNDNNNNNNSNNNNNNNNDNNYNNNKFKNIEIKTKNIF
jgi:hypothetical protein